MTIRTETRRAARALAVLGTLGALALGAAPSVKPAPRPLAPMPKIPPYTKVQYDSMMSVNDKCPVRHGHLNPGIRPVYVNRRPVGFC